MVVLSPAGYQLSGIVVRQACWCWIRLTCRRSLRLQVASGCPRLWCYGDGWADPLGELALIGRAAETEIIDRLLGGGKSALLAYARARADGMGVLQTAGLQSEAEIEFAALYQLLRPALDGVGSLPPPQSAALGAALGVEPGRPANRFLIGAAVLSVLSAAAGDRPLLCLWTTRDG